MNKPTRRVTMAQVAKLAGVSSTTVSFVVNEDPRAQSISLATRERVIEAVQALRYRPNYAARGLRRQRSETIAFIADEIATSPFAGDTIRGAQEYAWSHNCLLTVLNTGGDSAMEETYVDMAVSRQFDGIIFGTAYTREIAPPRNLDDLPAILLNCFSRHGGYSSVIPAEREGARAAARILLEAGHRRIGFINGIESHYAARERRLGFEQALQEFGLEYDDSLVRYGNYQSDSGHEHAHDLLNMTNPPTALFCSSDRMAVGAYYAILELGLNIPRDVSVVGYDNQVELAHFASPPLTSIQLPHYEMGVHAARMLLEGRGSEGSTDQVACIPVIRDSVAPPRLR